MKSVNTMPCLFLFILFAQSCAFISLHKPDQTRISAETIELDVEFSPHEVAVGDIVVALEDQCRPATIRRAETVPKCSSVSVGNGKIIRLISKTKATVEFAKGSQLSRTTKFERAADY